MSARATSSGRAVLTAVTLAVLLATLPALLADQLPAETMRTVLSGYRNRYAAISDAVTEVEPSFDDALLGTLPVIDVLTVPVHVLAERWREGSPTQ